MHVIVTAITIERLLKKSKFSRVHEHLLSIMK